MEDSDSSDDDGSADDTREWEPWSIRIRYDTEVEVQEKEWISRCVGG